MGVCVPRALGPSGGASWLDGVSEGQRGIGSVGHVVGEGTQHGGDVAAARLLVGATDKDH